MNETFGKPYERLAESGSPTEAQKNVAMGYAGNMPRRCDLLADGRLRVYVMDRSEIIQRIAYISRDGTVIEEA